MKKSYFTILVILLLMFSDAQAKEKSVKNSNEPVVLVKDFNLITIYVDDFEKCAEFYTKILGFEKTQDMQPGALFKLGKDKLMIYLEGGREKRDTAGTKFSATCLCLSAQNGVKDAYEKLKKAGVKMIGNYNSFAPEFHSFQCADPAGNIIEFAGKP